MHLLALNCGSSSIKGKLFTLPASSKEPLVHAAKIAVSNIGAKGDKVTTKIEWDSDKGHDVDEVGEQGDRVEHRELFPQILDHLGDSGVKREDIKYIVHRIVHGGEHKKGVVVTKDHHEALQEMDELSTFAPLHNHHAVLGVRACLDDLPEHTSLMLFDTLFHQTLSPEVYTYPLPSPDTKLPIPLRKYGFHGLSYASIVNTLSRTWDKPRDKINLVVAHLGSGASACCIRGGESIDTSMGLTPLEGLVGGTRTGTIDPTAIFHQTSDFAADAGLKDISVTKAEYVMNKKSGLTALAGTQNYAIITARAADKSLSNCTAEEHESAKLAHAVFVDRLLSHISSYLCKLLSSVPLEEITLVFSGGIGENSAPLRADVLKHFGWLGAKVDEKKNDVKHGQVRVISADNSKLNAVVVETDEEGWCAHMAREEFGF